MGANQSQIIAQSQNCSEGNLKDTPVFITETTNNDGSESTTISLSNFNGCSYNRTITIDKSADSKNLEYSVVFSDADGLNQRKKIYDLKEGFSSESQESKRRRIVNKKVSSKSQSPRGRSPKRTAKNRAESRSRSPKSRSSSPKSRSKAPKRSAKSRSSSPKSRSKSPKSRSKRSSKGASENPMPQIKISDGMNRNIGEKTSGAPINNDMPFLKEYLLEYNDSQIYDVGTVVVFDGKLYRLNTFIGIYGYNPIKFPNYWNRVKSVTDSSKPPVPVVLPMAPLPERPPPKHVSQDIIPNVGGPSWGQYVIKPNLVQNEIALGSVIIAGFTKIKVGDEEQDYSNNNTYRLGDVVIYNNKTYINLSYKDERGDAFSGSFQSSPDKDKNVWKEIKIKLPPFIPGKINVTEATYGGNCNGVTKGNRTSLFRKLTKDKVEFEYTYDSSQTGGDPASGCGKELEINYNCGDGKDKYFKVPSEAGSNGKVSLECIPDPKPGEININEATYGLNCNAALKGNRTPLFKKLASGKIKLDYTYDYNKTGGDPAGGCGKELEVKYDCGDGKQIYFKLPSEAGNNGIVELDCTPPPAITNKTFQMSSIKSANLVNWFDANDIKADGSNVPNGTQITTWADKTNNNNDAVKGDWGKPPVLLANNLNKLSVIDLQGSTQLSFSVGSKLQKYSVFTVQFSKGSFGDWQRLLHGQSGGDGRLLYGLRAGTDLWTTGFGNGGWANLDANQPEQKTDGKWTLADVIVDVAASTANPSFNGTLQTKKNMALDGFDSMTIGCQNGGTQPWRGFVAEILVFDGLVSDNDRTIIQGYLAWKWGLQDNLFKKHPYKYVNLKLLPDPAAEIPPVTDKTFEMKSIKSASLIGWFDANDVNADGSTTQDGTKLTIWADKTINSNDAIKGNSSGAPVLVTNKVNGLAVLELQGATVLNVPLGVKLQKYSIFSVQFSKGDYGDWQRLINGQSNGDGRLLYGLKQGGDSWVTGLGNGGWTNLEANTPERKTDGKWTFADVVVDVTTNTTYPSFNGTAQNKKSVALDGFDSLTIGSVNGGQPWKGSVGEILIFNGLVSDEERSLIQGYLATKWGLQQNLSKKHPYKYINMKLLPEPVAEITNKTFQMSSIKSAELVSWFDATDVNGDGSSVPDGTKITTWVDKTNNGNDAIKGNSSGAPILMANKVNGLAALDLQGATVLNSSFESKLQKYSIFSVQFSKGDYGDWQRLINGQSNGDGRLLYGLKNGGDSWITAVGNGRWTDEEANTPNKKTDGKWTFADVLVDVPSNTANPSFNGAVQNKKSGPLDGFDSLTIGSLNGGQTWKGLVGEILIFNGLISDEERSLIQGYLASKWGLKKNLARTHPYKNINITLLPNVSAKQELTNKTFEMGSIKSANLVGWFDANDIKGDKSNAPNGTQITTWADKTDNSNDAVKGNWGNPPVVVNNGLNKLSIIDLQGTTELSFSVGSKLQKYSIFSVQFSKGPYENYQRLLHGQSGGDGRLLYGLLKDSWMTGFGNGGWTNLDANQPEKKTDGKWTLADVTVDVAASTANPSFNGTLQTKKNMALDGFDSMTIGCQNGGTQPWRGSVAEILVFDGLINDNDRSLIQGYLATKWGLQKILPKTHPYKYINMAVLPNPPRAPKLVGWYDGADVKGDGSVVPAETKIDKWFDKSPSKNNMIAQLPGTYDSDSKSVKFSPSWYRAEKSIKAYPVDVYMVVKVNSINSHNDVFGYTSLSSDNFNSLTFSEYASGKWHNGSSSFSRTPKAVAADKETSTEFLLIQWSISNKNFYIYRNGTKIMNSTDYSWDLPSDPYFQLGNRVNANAGGALQGNIAEVQIFKGQLNDENRQKIEGVLAKKWGIDYYLPENHPFKGKIPPRKNPEFVETKLICRHPPYISMDNTGKNIAISMHSSNIYFSNDFGSNWKPLRNGIDYPFNNFTSVYISNDAKHMVYNGWQVLFYSTDQGATWTKSTTNDAYGQLTVSYPSNIVGSDDGSVLYGGGYKICKSVDFGKTWNVISEIGLDEGDLTINFACSANGSVVIFARRAGDGSGRIFISRDSGSSWNATSLPRMYSQKIFCSSDAKIIAVCAGDLAANAILHISTDGGNTWTEKKTLQPKFRSASGFGMSRDGSTMVFGGQDWWNGPKDVVVSYDLGDTWLKCKAPQYNWEAFAFSGNGKIIVGAPYNRNRTDDYVCMYKNTVEGFTNMALSKKKYCNLPNKKYIDGILNEKINSDGSVITKITIPPFDGCYSGKTITINVSRDLKKLVLENNFKGIDGNNIIETYNYMVHERDCYNKYITFMGILIILCLIIFYFYKRRRTLLITQ